jgi:hypothetical protein
MRTFGCAMAIRARSTIAPSGNSPALMRRSRSRLSADGRSRKGELTPGRSKAPRCSRIASCGCSSTYAFPSRTSRSAHSYMRGKKSEA